MLNIHACLLHLVCVCLLTLVYRSLLASPLLRSYFLFAVMLQRSEGHTLACFLLHSWQQICVVYSAMGTVGGEDGGTHVSAALRSAQDAWSA